MNQFDLNTLEKYIEERLIVKQKHPSLDLWIYNYTPECVFSKKWDEITTQCRGLILDKEGKIIARPFPKFFNYEELEGLGIKLPKGIPKIYKKMDGSLIIVTRYENELVTATRGSFVSDQVKIARELLFRNKELLDYLFTDRQESEEMKEHRRTYLFELIGPDNRIVVNYPKNKLVLLAIIESKTEYEGYLDFYRSLPVDVVEEYKAEWNENTIKTLQNLNLNNEEEFVLKWDNNFRCKIKFSDYVKLHRLVTGLNEKTIWEWLKGGREIEELQVNVPEEFSNWIYDKCSKILHNYKEVYQQCERFIFNNKLDNLSRKAAAIQIMKEMKEYQAVLFSFLDKQPERIHENIYKLIKPKTNKVFKDMREEI